MNENIINIVSATNSKNEIVELNVLKSEWTLNVIFWVDAFLSDGFRTIRFDNFEDAYKAFNEYKSFLKE